ncbi:MAG: hypothetical protein M4D80_06595 [Myxococcota bacterium]|nr:hypothetical protein [Deltaproteobacteria bacterium]MDQ3334808.1 hypothetical protein [Myxococcota bacterium]
MLDLSHLVRRDHDDLNHALRVLSEPVTTEADLVAMSERVRTRFAAHAEAEAAALGAVLEQTRPAPALYFLVSQVIAAHLAQETVVTQLLSYRVGSAPFRERAQYLRQLIVHHAEHEAACLQPALPDHLPRPIFRTLATCYAVERARVLDEHRKLACVAPLIARSA